MHKKIILVLVMVAAVGLSRAQELQARLTVTASKISTQIDKKIFQTLQTSLTNFINNRRWSTDTYQPNEKIQCNFLLSVDQDLGSNMFKGKLTVQAARPIFNTAYDSPIINFL